MKVKLYATLRPLVDAPEVEVDAGPGDTIGKVLQALVARYPQLAPEIFEADGHLRDRIHVFIDGRDVRYLEGLDTPIKEGNDVRIFPPVGGGEETFPYKETRQVRGVPAWLIDTYLEKLGGKHVGNHVWKGDTWRVTVREQPPARVGNLSVGQVLLVMETRDAPAFRSFFQVFDRMLMRGGG